MMIDLAEQKCPLKEHAKAFHVSSASFFSVDFKQLLQQCFKSCFEFNVCMSETCHLRESQFVEPIT